MPHRICRPISVHRDKCQMIDSRISWRVGPHRRKIRTDRVRLMRCLELAPKIKMAEELAKMLPSVIQESPRR